MSTRLTRAFRLGEFLVDPTARIVTSPDREIRISAGACGALVQLAEHAGTFVSAAELATSIGVASRAQLDDVLNEWSSVFGDSADALIETSSGSGIRLRVEPKSADDETEANTEPAVMVPSNERMGLIKQLRQRGVIEVAVTYLVVGWLLLQIADVTFDQLGLPPWAGTFVTFLVIAGFPIAVLLAWFVEITEKGAVLDTDPGSRAGRQPFGRRYLAIVGAFALAALGVLAFDRYVGLPGESEEQAASESLPVSVVNVEPDSIAVLPFFNIDGSDETRIFSDGLAEDVINRLARVPGLRVSSRGDSFSLEPNTPSQDVRNRLRVAYYLEGSVRLTDETLRVVVQLIDSATGFHLLSRSFDRALDDFFELQDEITSLTVANLRVALPPDTQLDIETVPVTTELDAYVYYRRGMDVLYAPLTMESIQLALEYFRQSLDVDQEYAAAHAGICQTYSSGYNVTFDPSFIDEAEAACGQALNLNPNLYVVHNAMGDLYVRTGQYGFAEDSFQMALAVNEDDVDALTGLAEAHWRNGSLQEAEERFKQAIGLQPGNWSSYYELGGFLHFNGRYREAAAQYREVVSLDDRNQVGWANLASSLMLSGEFAPSAEAFERAVEIEPRSTTYKNLGLLHYYLGDLDQAASVLREAIQLQSNDHLTWSNLGDVLTFAGEPDPAREAFLTAERLVEERLGINDREAEILLDLAWIKAMLGEIEQAEQLLDEASAITSSDPYVLYYRALVSVRKGDLERAVEYLEMAADMGYSRVMIAAEPHLAALRDEPRFVELVAQ